MIKSVFSLVASSLVWLAKLLHLTYNEINILVYYLLIPLSWTIMLDIRLGCPIATFALTFTWLGIFLATRHFFSEWCDWVFSDSVSFLMWFNRWGSNYILSSVIICVVIPLIIYALLISLII